MHSTAALLVAVLALLLGQAALGVNVRGGGALEAAAARFEVGIDGYVAVIDAGSSGTRITLLSWWRESSGAPQARLIGKPVKVKDTVAGSNPSRCSVFMPKLLKGFKASLPKEASSEEIPLFFFATGAIRMRDEATRARMLDECRAALSRSGFAFKREYAKALSTEEEAAYGWLSVQAAADPRGNKLPYSSLFSGSSYGAIDAGSSSLEIAYRPSVDMISGNFPIELGSGQTLNLFAHGFPYYGVDEMRNRINSVAVLTHAASLHAKAKQTVEKDKKDMSKNKQPLPKHLVEAAKPDVSPAAIIALFESAPPSNSGSGKNDVAAGAVPHPCFPRGLLQTDVFVASVGSKVKLLGTGNYKACRALVRELLHKDALCLSDPKDPQGSLVKSIPSEATAYGFAPEPPLNGRAMAVTEAKNGNGRKLGEGSTCSIDGTYAPPLPRDMSFFAYGAYSYSFEMLGLDFYGSSLLDYALAVKRECFSAPASTAATPKGQKTKTKKQSSRPAAVVVQQQWKDIKARHPKVPQEYLRHLCPNGVYLATLLIDGFRLDARKKGLVKVIPSSQHVTWAQGAVLPQLLAQTLALPKPAEVPPVSASPSAGPSSLPPRPSPSPLASRSPAASPSAAASRSPAAPLSSPTSLPLPSPLEQTKQEGLLPGAIGPDPDMYAAVKLAHELKQRAEALLGEREIAGGSDKLYEEEKRGVPARIRGSAAFALGGGNHHGDDDKEEAFDGSNDVRMTLKWSSQGQGRKQ